MLVGKVALFNINKPGSLSLSLPFLPLADTEMHINPALHEHYFSGPFRVKIFDFQSEYLEVHFFLPFYLPMSASFFTLDFINRTHLDH